MGAVVNPFARGRDPLASGNGCGMANHGHDVTMPARLGAQNAKTIFGIVVGYSLDEARQHFLGRRFRLRTHAHYPVPPSGPSNARRFGMLGGKRLSPKLSDPPRVKSQLVWQKSAKDVLRWNFGAGERVAPRVVRPHGPRMLSNLKICMPSMPVYSPHSPDNALSFGAACAIQI